jgi:Cu/Zn superoxide dismutase
MLQQTALLLLLGFCLCFADKISDSFVLQPNEFTKMEEVYKLMERRREARMAERSDLVLAGVAFLRETSIVGSLIIGIIDFYQTSSAENTFVDAFVYAQNNYLVFDSYYGMNVHSYGDLSSTQGEAIGANFIGRGSPVHGCPPNPIRQEGNMGNFLVNEHGIISEWKELDLLNAFNNGSGVPSSIIGRAVALRGIQDPCDSSYLGPKIAIGTIGIGYDSPNNVGLDIEPDALVAHVTGTSYCFECQASVWIWKEVDLESGNDVIRVRARAYSPYDESRGWNSSSHGWAIHQWGDVSTKNGFTIGDHFDNNENIRFHGLPPSPNRHAGDLGNSMLVLPYNGGPYVQTWLDVTLESDTFSLQAVAGRTIVYYSSYDRGFACQPYGGSGSVWGMGVLGIANPALKVPKIPKSAVPVLPDTFDNEDCLSSSFNDAPVSSASGFAVSVMMVFVTLFAFLF